jgi:hypothetical protein
MRSIGFITGGRYFVGLGYTGGNASVSIELAIGIEFKDVFGLAQGERAKSLRLSSVFALRYALGLGKSETLLAGSSQDGASSVEFTTHSQTVNELTLHVGSSLHF